MAEVQRVQSRAERALAILALVFGLSSLIALAALSLLEPVGADVTHRAIRDSARLPVVMWCLGWPIALAKPVTGPGTPFAWALGGVLCLVHIAVAFHLGHGWSHARAWEHTREAGGYGDGVFVNYAFVFVWLLDGIWASVAFGSYTTRPRWLHWGVHGFLAFVVFNAAFVFASWPMRLTFATFFLGVLAAVVWAKRRRPVDAPPAG